jgi:hypothetical protein
VFDDKRQRALEWLYLELRITKVRLGHAERKRGVKPGELDALRERIENIETSIECVRKAEA